MKTLSVVIVLYNEFNIITRCISSINKERIKNSEIIIVDNNSEKTGFKKILTRYPKIKFIRNKRNLGFAGAANVGFRNAKGEYILLLTPDTTLKRGTIKKTLEYIKKNKRVGLVGCRVYSYPAHFHLSAFRSFPGIVNHLFEYNIPYYKIVHYLWPKYHPIYFSEADHKKPLNAEHIIGAYMLIRKKAGKDVGFFSKEFYMYREETDLCMKLRNKGWEVHYLPVGGLVHYGGATWKKFTYTQSYDRYQMSTYEFFKKYHSKAYLFCAWSIALLSTILSLLFLIPIILIRVIQNRKSQSFNQFKDWGKILYWHLTRGLVFVLFK